MRKSIAPTVATALAFIGLAQAQDLTARKVESAFDTWADASGIRNASLVLMKDNRIILKLNRGGYATATAEPAASNSKLITGLCIARLADSGQVSFFCRLGRRYHGCRQRCPNRHAIADEGARHHDDIGGARIEDPHQSPILHTSVRGSELRSVHKLAQTPRAFHNKAAKARVAFAARCWRRPWDDWKL